MSELVYVAAVGIQSLIPVTELFVSCTAVSARIRAHVELCARMSVLLVCIRTDHDH